MLSKEDIKYIFRKNDFKILKSLGQNFLIDEKVLKKIITSSDLKKEDVVFEIGPGFGTLTFALLKECKKIVAIEKDKKMGEWLKNKLSEHFHSNPILKKDNVLDSSHKNNFPEMPNVEILTEDILKINLKEFIRTHSSKGKYKLISNIPYYITSPIIKLFLEAEEQPKVIVLLIQKEVAERICAKPGKMSILALSVQIYGKPEIVDFVDKSSFYPEPKVDSAILKIKNIQRKKSRRVSTKNLFRIIKFGFSSKRKKLINNLSAGLHIDKMQSEKILTKAGINLNVRAQELKLEEWEKLAERIN